MRGHIALQKHSGRNPRRDYLFSSGSGRSFGVRTRPRVALIIEHAHSFTRRSAFTLLRRDNPESFRGWRRGELNPCPRRYPRTHLHVYPAINSEEPSHAPAHCRLPSVREIDSRTGAVAPPFD